MAKEKETKPIEKTRKGYKIRGIVYASIIVVLVILAILMCFKGVQRQINKVVYPKVVQMTLNGQKVDVYSELSVEGGYDFSSYYYINSAGEKRYLPTGSYRDNDGTVHLISGAFKAKASVRLGIIRGAVNALIVLFAVIFIIYLIRLILFIKKKDEEWNTQITRFFDTPRAVKKRNRQEQKELKKAEKQEKAAEEKAEENSEE